MEWASLIAGIIIGTVLGLGGAFVAFNSRLVRIETNLNNAIREMKQMDERFEKNLQMVEERWKDFLNHSFDQWQTLMSKLLTDMPNAIGKSIGQTLNQK